jgi:lysophospholipase L1-like esterase
LNANSRGVGVGLKNFQAFGGDDRGFNALLCGSGADLGKMQILKFDGTSQAIITSGTALTLAAGDTMDCSFTRTGWDLIAAATNLANGQWSTTKMTFSSPANLPGPTISRLCFYPLSGSVYIDDFSFTINRRKPARFLVVGASICDGYRATAYAQSFVKVIQSNFVEAVCNDSNPYNTTADALSSLPEILVHQPGTALLMVGANDVQFGVPTAQWQNQYSNFVAQLQANGTHVKHCVLPRSTVDLNPLRTWILNSYATNDVIDTWTPFLSGTSQLKSIYDGGDGIHPNDAGHLLLGSIIRTNLP